MLSRILFEDKDIIVTYKPAGLAVQTARLGQPDMISELKNHLYGRSGRGAGQKEPYLGVVHRLDQPVEGILVFAKTRAAAASLTGQLQSQGQEGSFCKQYYAVLRGIPVAGEGELTDYLEKRLVTNGRQKEYIAVVVRPEDSPGTGKHFRRPGGEAPGARALGKSGKARKAVLRYRILETSQEQGLALAEILLRTGRFHQIRAQMAHAGTPILGDQKYGNQEAKAQAGALGIRNAALCACRVGFLHPVSKERMDFQVKPENPAFSSFSQL